MIPRSLFSIFILWVYNYVLGVVAHIFLSSVDLVRTNLFELYLLVSIVTIVFAVLSSRWLSFRYLTTVFESLIATR